MEYGQHLQPLILSCRLSKNLRGGYHHLTAKGWQRSKQYNIILPDQFNLMHCCAVDLCPCRTALLQQGVNSHVVDLELFSAIVEVARTRNFISSETSKTISTKANVLPFFSTPVLER